MVFSTVFPTNMKKPMKNRRVMHMKRRIGWTYEAIFPELNSVVRKPGRLKRYHRVLHILVSN